MGSHRLLTAMLIALVALLLSGCTTTRSDDEATDAAEAEDTVASEEESSGGDSDVEELDLDTWEPHSPELDVETLEASGPEGTYEAEQHEDTYVGEVDDELFISVSLQGDYPSQSADEVLVYLCDGKETQVYLSGEVDSETTALSDDGTLVELTVNEDADTVTGSVTLGDEESQSFEAIPAEDHAGLYTAQLTAQDTDFWAGWIVLNDGRQQGLSCCCSFIDGVPPGCGRACCLVN